MKLSKNTLDVMKNFSVINPAMGLYPGNFISSISKNGDMFAQAEIEETLPPIVDGKAINQLDRVLSLLSLMGMEEAELDFDEHMLNIKGDNTKAKYYFQNRDYISSKEPNTAKESFLDFEFEASYVDIENVLKSCQVLQLPHFLIEGIDGKAYISSINVKASENTYKIELGDYGSDINFRLVFEANKIKLLPYNYRIKVDRKLFVNLTATDSPLELRYWVAATHKYSEITE